ncbi:MAG: hypothetical protein ACUVV6_06030 [Thermoplasmatota archaeon]
MSERKIRKLTEMIEKAREEVGELEERLRRAKERCHEGRLSKADYAKAKMELSNLIRGQRARIVRLEKARLNLERMMKEKREEEELEMERRRELRAERRREREKERRRRLRLGAGGAAEREAGGGPEGDGERGDAEDQELAKDKNLEEPQGRGGAVEADKESSGGEEKAAEGGQKRARRRGILSFLRR